MRIPCDIIQDLLPLYADDACSALSKREVGLHLRTCAQCAGKLQQTRADHQSPESEEAAPVKAAAAAWKRGTHKAFLKGGCIVLIVVALLAGILAHCLLPSPISVNAFKTDGIFQHRVFRWDLSETAVRLLCGNKMVVDPGNIILTDFEQEIWAMEACTFNGEVGDLSFYFRDNELEQMKLFFRNMKNDEWGPQVLEQLREVYGPETKEHRDLYGRLVYYIWELGETCMLFSPGERGTPHLTLLKETIFS